MSFKTKFHASLIAVPALTAALVALKSLSLISWSWVWVLSPAWGSLAFAALVVLIFAIGSEPRPETGASD